MVATDLAALGLGADVAAAVAALLEGIDWETASDVLREASALMGGFGVESIDDPDRPADPAALYVSVGDPYRPTVLWDCGREEVVICGYGDWLEGWEAAREAEREERAEDGAWNDGYCECGEPWDRDCMGRRRCPDCDGPCLCCYDGGGPI